MEPEEPTEEYWAFFGVYTRDTSKGIYKSRFDAATGTLGEPELAAEIENPSFLTFHPNKKFLYAVTEADAGTVSAFAVNRETGNLMLLNTQPTNGAAPCDLEVDATESMLVVANYTSGSTIAYQVGEDGLLSEPTSFHEHEGSGPHARQKSPHAHSVDFSADNRFVMVSDLGTDEVITYEADVANGKLTQVGAASVQPGSGPRHFVFHPSDRFAYSLGEIGSNVTLMSYSDGKLEAIGDPVSTLPADFEGENNTAEIAVDPAGKFLYASNRGHDSIAVFAIDQESGALELTANVSTQGETPRNFAIDPTGKWLLAANQNTNNVVVYSIDKSTGGLTPTGTQITVDAPVCIDFLKM